MKDLFNWNMDNFKFNFSRRVSLGAKVLITKVLIKCYCAMSDFLVTFFALYAQTFRGNRLKFLSLTILVSRQKFIGSDKIFAMFVFS